jgi:cytochrome P450
VFEARDRGELTTREAKALVIDFIAPALDTTILASTHLLWALANNPDAWAQIRADPELIPTAVIENVRLASPIRGFTRTVASDTEVDGVTVPAGSRVVLLYGAANLDETQFPDPERFDLTRDSKVQLGWGNGAHTCVGLHLSKLEMQALLRAMVPRVEAIHAAGHPRTARSVPWLVGQGPLGNPGALGSKSGSRRWKRASRRSFLRPGIENAQEGVHDRRVKLRTCIATQFRQGLVRRHRTAVGTRCRHRVVRVTG